MAGERGESRGGAGREEAHAVEGAPQDRPRLRDEGGAAGGLRLRGQGRRGVGAGRPARPGHAGAPVVPPGVWQAPGDALGERRREVADRDPRRLRVAAVLGQLAGEAGDRAGDSRPRAASILVSGPVTTLPHTRRLSCGMIPPRNQESYVFPRRPSVLPTKNREGHNSLFHLEWYLHFSLLLIFIENGHIDLAYAGTPSAQDGNVDCLIVRPP